MKKYKNYNGITLIALIITIILLIILAGISISTLTNQGLLKNAKKAKEKYQESEINEKITLLKYEMQLDESITLKEKMINEGLIDKKEINEKGISNINNDDNFIVISNYNGLKELSKEVNEGKDYAGKNIYLIDNIDCNADFDSETGKLISGEKFESIGDSNSRIEDEILEGSIKKEFNGNFNGLGYTIKNMYINENSEGNYCAGLFGYIGKNGKVQDIIIQNSYISGYYETGSIVGRNRGIISNCKNYSQINGAKLTGGIVGRSCGTIENCANYGNIITTDIQTGGIVGNCDYGENVIVKNCENHGDVNSTKISIGGIIGGAYRSNETVIINISDCKNYGNIGKFENNNVSVGGIVGALQQSIKNCTNYGIIRGKENVGGIVGYTNYASNNTSLIQQSKNYDLVNGTYKCVGGICGFNTGGKILECSNIGEVILNGEEAYYGVGGIAGAEGSSKTDIYIEKCYNIGKITLELTNSKSCQIAGIVGNLGMATSGEYKGYVKDCYNKGEIICIGNGIKKQGAAGITSWSRYAVIQNCYNIGKLVGVDNSSSGIAGSYGQSISVENNYWLDTCGATYGIGQGNSNIGAELKSSEELKQLAEKLGDSYEQDDNINDGYPYLVDNKQE